MRNIFLFAASTLLLLAGCTKEDSTEFGEERTAVTFTASMAEFADTKAAADGDGAAASVNRCIMEIYYDGSLYSRNIQPVAHNGGTVTATFTAQVVADRTYKAAFWADHVNAANTTPTTTELESDLHYVTNADQPDGGLQAIVLKGKYAGNDDTRDAFFASGEFTVAQKDTVREVILRRPFAQINVIITNWNQLTTTPDSVDVTIYNPFTKFDALTGTASENITNLTYSTVPYKTQATTDGETTLSMDYIFAADTQAYINIDWKAKKNSGSILGNYTFTNISYRRNYRTNIKASLTDQ